VWKLFAVMMRVLFDLRLCPQRSLIFPHQLLCVSEAPRSLRLLFTRQSPNDNKHTHTRKKGRRRRRNSISVFDIRKKKDRKYIAVSSARPTVFLLCIPFFISSFSPRKYPIIIIRKERIYFFFLLGFLGV
jgi:hypothetical protein